nr:MAG TPA: hypothetical protein [Caudoviricetes sp.]
MQTKRTPPSDTGFFLLAIHFREFSHCVAINYSFIIYQVFQFCKYYFIATYAIYVQ